MRILTLLISLTAATLAGCGSSSSPGLQQQPASNTSMMAFVGTGAAGRLYLPSAFSLGTGIPSLAVVNAGAPGGTSGLLHYIDLGPGAVPRAVGSSGTDVVVIDRDSASVHFVDARTDTVVGTAPFPAGAELMLTSNAPGYYSGGVAVDAKSRKAYVSSSLGFLQYDLDSRILTDTFPAFVAEGFSLDSKAGRIYSPFYLCDPNPSDPGFCYPYAQPGGPDLTDSVDVVDLASGRTYSLVDPAAPDPHAPLGFDPDDMAVDFTLDVAVVANEESASVRVVDLATTTYDDATLTCRMSSRVVAMPDAFYTALAADPATHLLVVAQEDGPGVVFLDLAKAKKGVISQLPAVMPNTPDDRAWGNVGDPHGPVIGVVSGRAYAFLPFYERTWIARIDLAGVRQVLDGQGAFADHVQFISVPAPP